MMSTRDLRAAFDLIRDNSSLVTFAGPQPDDRVKRGQTALGIIFPPTYKEFVSKLGCGGYGSAEFYGIVADDFAHSSVPDAVWVTIENRKDGSIPDYLVVVGSTGDGGYYTLDTSQRDSNGESPIVEWWPGFPRSKDNPRMVAPDFGAFFLEEITQALARERCRSERADPAPSDSSEEE